MTIALKTAEILENRGVEIEILPPKIPRNYSADVFLSLHSDQNKDENVSGFKIAWSFFDKSKKSFGLAKIIEKEYQNITKMKKHNFITKNMTHYYAFNWKNLNTQ